MWKTIRGYLTFTRKERFGVLFLLFLISILFILPYFFKPKVGDPDPEAFEKVKEGIRKFESIDRDSSHDAVTHERFHQDKADESFSVPRDPARFSPAPMFYFDPNTTDALGWKRLGLQDHLVNTILHYVERGGRFRKAEDLNKIYGLRSEDYKRLLPFVRINREPEIFSARYGNFEKPVSGMPSGEKADSSVKSIAGISFHQNPWTFAGKKLNPTDINEADTAVWSRLPGIGERLASRIVRFREKLGGFYRVDQVAETFGLPDSTFQKIKPALRLHMVSLVKLDLNSATKEMLQSHPYIRWQIAKEIVAYRMQHGSFHSIDELLQLAQVDTSKFEKVKPYLVIKP